jgi:hypothetical protein
MPGDIETSSQQTTRTAIPAAPSTSEMLHGWRGSGAIARLAEGFD